MAMAAVQKTDMRPVMVFRGFESHTLRQGYAQFVKSIEIGGNLLEQQRSPRSKGSGFKSPLGCHHTRNSKHNGTAADC